MSRIDRSSNARGPLGVWGADPPPPAFGRMPPVHDPMGAPGPHESATEWLCKSPPVWLVWLCVLLSRDEFEEFSRLSRSKAVEWQTSVCEPPNMLPDPLGRTEPLPRSLSAGSASAPPPFFFFAERCFCFFWYWPGMDVCTSPASASTRESVCKLPSRSRSALPTCGLSENCSDASPIDGRNGSPPPNDGMRKLSFEYCRWLGPLR
mmetsp:Transcript_94872/g.271288  ORF Transcript_94872/g.271288 Transcript_94872/m.271288 type:complete len:206 (-) Transcript_94872:146-763(-)